MSTLRRRPNVDNHHEKQKTLAYQQALQMQELAAQLLDMARQLNRSLEKK